MRIGIPTEIKADENRVAITPSGVAAFVARGHDLIIEAGAGTGSAIPDRAYRDAGATVVAGADAVWERADLILKVKEPLDPEFDQLRERLAEFQAECLATRSRLGVVPGDRGFVEGWE